MPIEINGSSTPQTRQTGEGGPLRIVRDATTSPQNSGGGTTSQDSVSLTGVSALMQQLDSRISALPIVDTARINTIRQSIADGNYHPDPLQVAHKLIDHEIALQRRA